MVGMPAFWNWPASVAKETVSTAFEPVRRLASSLGAPSRVRRQARAPRLRNASRSTRRRCNGAADRQGDAIHVALQVLVRRASSRRRAGRGTPSRSCTRAPGCCVRCRPRSCRHARSRTACRTGPDGSPSCSSMSPADGRVRRRAGQATSTALAPARGSDECASLDRGRRSRNARSTCARRRPPSSSARRRYTWSRARQVLAETGDRVERAGAADLLVVGEQQVDRLGELALVQRRQHGEADRVERLHVAGAAAIEACRRRGAARTGRSTSSDPSPARRRCGPRARCRRRPPDRWWRTGRPCRLPRWARGVAWISCSAR